VKTIPLTQGKVAFVDDEDFERVNQFKWSARWSQNGRWYALRNVHPSKDRRAIQSMHRFIMGLEYGDPREVDHKDRINTLDNRKSNLRVTLDQNSQNRGIPITNKSGVKGVHWDEQREKWVAYIGSNGKRFNLGRFPTSELAAQAYDAAAKEIHGEFACTNEMLGLLKKPVQSVMNAASAAA
jgi:hypothetical protein